MASNKLKNRRQKSLKVKTDLFIQKKKIQTNKKINIKYLQSKNQ